MSEYEYAGQADEAKRELAVPRALTNLAREIERLDKAVGRASERFQDVLGQGTPSEGVSELNAIRSSGTPLTAALDEHVDRLTGITKRLEAVVDRCEL